MKRYILLLSSIGLSASALAQSSVTIFGVVDATVAYGSGSIANRTQLAQSGNFASRLGFRGTEDLGGGLKAGFWLEAGMNNGDGAGIVTNTNNQSTGSSGGGGLTFGRRSTVQFAGPWGELRLGRDLTPQYWGYLKGDPFGNVGVGAAVNYTASITGPTNTRASNSIAYFSPLLSGLSANLMHYFGENASGAATSRDGTGTGVRLAYTAGHLSVGAAFARTEYAAGDTYQRNIDAQWDFGSARLVGDLSRDRAGTVSAHGGSLGLIVPVGVGELKAAYSLHKTDAAGSPGTKKLAVGYVHNLSKRTALYATYATLRNSGGAAFALNGAVTAPNQSSSGLDLGLRHNF